MCSFLHQLFYFLWFVLSNFSLCITLWSQIWTWWLRMHLPYIYLVSHVVNSLLHFNLCYLCMYSLLFSSRYVYMLMFMNNIYTKLIPLIMGSLFCFLHWCSVESYYSHYLFLMENLFSLVNSEWNMPRWNRKHQKGLEKTNSNPVIKIIL